ncbi:MAG: hypothetical protein KAR47_11830 [Planctomycetes bacterium]|nr:hypothetical protein [Planctomycetota bacterium]
MTKAEVRQIRRYLGKIRERLYDFSIGTASRQAELAKLEEVITDIMVASAESEKGAGRVELYLLETKARHCREIILKLMGRQN